MVQVTDHQVPLLTEDPHHPLGDRAAVVGHVVPDHQAARAAVQKVPEAVERQGK